MLYCCIIVTVVFWASAFVGIRGALADYSPLELAAFRYFVAALILAGVAIIKRIRLMDVKDIGTFLLLGFIGIFGYNIALNYGELYVTAGEACFIVNTVPIITTILAVIFLREPLTGRLVAGLSVSFCGVTLIAMQYSGGWSFKPGAVIIFMAALLQACFFIVQKKVLKKYSPLEITCFAIWSGALFLFPTGISFFSKISQAHPVSTAYVVYLGVFPAALAYVSWSYVLSRIPASKASLFLFAVPLATLVIGWIWLGEFPSTVSLIGGIIAIAGAFTGSAAAWRPQGVRAPSRIHVPRQRPLS